MNLENRDPEELIEKIRAEFPELVFTNAQLVTNQSDDHTVFILGDQWVFRFPRSDSYRASFKHELAILEALRPITHVPVPFYEYVSRNKDFGGYKMFKGVELELEQFKALTGAAQNKLASDLGELNSAMHSLSTELRPPVVGDDPETYPQFFARKRELLAGHSRELTEQLDGFFATYERIQPQVKKLVHGDLVGEHIFYDLQNNRVSGIIDFSDTYPGDPAADFTYFWTYGHDFPRKMLDSYSFKNDDPGLIDRSHWYFVRYQVSRLVDALEEEDAVAADRHTALIFEHLPEVLGLTS